MRTGRRWCIEGFGKVAVPVWVACRTLPEGIDGVPCGMDFVGFWVYGHMPVSPLGWTLFWVKGHMVVVPLGYGPFFRMDPFYITPSGVGPAPPGLPFARLPTGLRGVAATVASGRQERAGV